jgi:hypothetical protein
MVASQEYFFRLSSFAASLIMAGWISHISRLSEDPKFLADIEARSAIKENMRTVAAMLGKRPGVHPYPLVRRYTRGRFVTVSLSFRLKEMIELYAAALGMSRNEALATFLQEGLERYAGSKQKFEKLEKEFERKWAESTIMSL